MLVDTVVDYVNSNRTHMIRELEDLVNIYSGTYMPDGTNKAARYVGDIISAIGGEVQYKKSGGFGDHMLATVGPETGDRIFVVGHLDTVFEEPDNWPFSNDGAKAFGPGVIDMKSGVLVFLWALRALDATVGVKNRFCILFNTDEEPGSPDSREFIPALADDCEFALVMEPAESTGEILDSRKGVGVFNFDVQGVSAHAGQEPEKGASAINAAAGIISQLAEVADLAAGTSVNVGTINGGTAPYAVPAACSFEVDVRARTVNEAQRVESEFAEIARQHSKGKITVTLGGQFHRPPMTPSPETHALVSRYQSVANAVGFEVTSTMSGAASDGNTLSGAGVPVLDGLGAVGGRAHSRDEYMETESFYQRTMALALFLSGAML